MLTFLFSGGHGKMTVPETLTTGMVGKQLLLEFTPEWDELLKTVVFSNGQVTRDVLYTGEPVAIPAAVLEKPLRTLTVGVYGVSADGAVVIPTVRAVGPRILPGIEPTGDTTTDPELPVWAQLQTMIGNLEGLETQARESLVAAINELALEIPESGATFTPLVDENGMLSWTNDRGLENPEPVNVKGPRGIMGAQGEKGDRGDTGPMGPQGLRGKTGAPGFGIYTTGENAPVDAEAGMESEFTLSEIVIPEGRSLSAGDFLFMANGTALFCITAVDETAGIVTAAYLASLKGAPGQKGDTPVRGTDYWTEEDRAEIKAYVDEAILGGAW